MEQFLCMQSVKNLTSICGRKQMEGSTPQETTDISG